MQEYAFTLRSCFYLIPCKIEGGKVNKVNQIFCYHSNLMQHRYANLLLCPLDQPSSNMPSVTSLSVASATQTTSDKPRRLAHLRLLHGKSEQFQGRILYNHLQVMKDFLFLDPKGSCVYCIRCHLQFDKR